MTPSLLLLLLSCGACFRNCFDPALPVDDNNDEDPPDDPEPIDTGDPKEDTGPLPAPDPCTFPEVEPNNLSGEAMPITMEAWACGTLLDDSGETGTDNDMLSFPVTDTGWISIWARGEDVGSFSDLELTVWVTPAGAEDYDELLLPDASPGSTDPRMTFPVEAGDTVRVSIKDRRGGAGPAYVWEFLATSEKEPPILCDVQEDEAAGGADNDVVSRAAQPLRSGEVLCGSTTNIDLRDHYTIEVPEGSTTLRVQTLAWQLGSAMDATLELIDPAGEVRRTARAADLVRDPEIDTAITEPGTWVLRVEADNPRGFTLAGWYGLQAEIETVPPDAPAPE